MPTRLVANEWGVILLHDHDLLELQWLASTAEMTDGGFMATLCLFASEAERARARRLLIDATQFRHRFGDGVMEWRDAHIIPRYGAAGGCQIALFMPRGVSKKGGRGGGGAAGFPAQWVVCRAGAVALGWEESER